MKHILYTTQQRCHSHSKKQSPPSINAAIPPSPLHTDLLYATQPHSGWSLEGNKNSSADCGKQNQSKFPSNARFESKIMECSRSQSACSNVKSKMRQVMCQGNDAVVISSPVGPPGWRRLIEAAASSDLGVYN
ncbi:hypothetical protein TNCV_3554561 [Trichonephila clavipes]|nr:hypothetical protein TNCV_3554561 [Trichonephila clavipes]